MNIMSISETAANRIKEIIANSENPVAGLRVGMKNAGCAGVAYTMEYVEEPIKGDDFVREHGVDIYVDPKATLFLLGTVMDFETTKLSSSFTFSNPNQVGACGCGESVQLEAGDLEELAKARAEMK